MVCVHEKTREETSMETIFMLAKIWNQSRWLSTVEQMDNLWYSHVMEYYIDTKEIRL